MERRLQGVYNLVDDLQLSRRDLSNALCEEEGLAPVIWENHDRPGARVFNARVSNARLRALGFTPSDRLHARTHSCRLTRHGDLHHHHSLSIVRCRKRLILELIIALAKVLEKLPEDFCVQSHANVTMFFYYLFFYFFGVA